MAILECEITINVKIEYVYHPPVKGARSSLGVPEEPDEPASFDVNKITDIEGNEVPITEEIIDQIGETIIDENL